jgi:hypothetical protein
MESILDFPIPSVPPIRSVHHAEAANGTSLMMWNGEKMRKYEKGGEGGNLLDEASTLKCIHFSFT